jgi:tripartite-type tricarboxylate transporter receptor subunit TctC
MLKFVVTVLISMGICLDTSAETYPSKPVELVVPFTPGGTVNVLARILAGPLAEAIGQPVIIENKPGAGGNLGANFVARSKADGYTVLFATMGNQVIQPLVAKSISPSPKEFTPIALFSTVPNVIVVSSNTPANNIAELVTYAKANPGKLNLGSAGNGSVNHMGGELFTYRTGARFTHIPYKGSGPATTDLVGGQIHVLFTNLPTVFPYIKSGRVRALAVAGDKRSPAIPDVPTLAEAGIKDAVIESWYGLMAPVGTNAQIIKKLQDAVVRVSTLKPVVTQLAEQGALSFPGTSDDLAKRITEDTRRWTEIVKAANIKVD